MKHSVVMVNNSAELKSQRSEHYTNTKLEDADHVIIKILRRVEDHLKPGRDLDL